MILADLIEKLAKLPPTAVVEVRDVDVEGELDWFAVTEVDTTKDGQAVRIG